MAGPAYGGETPMLKYGTPLTVEAPAATTSAAPVEAGDLFKLAGAVDESGKGYKIAACAAGDDPSEVVLVQAIMRQVEEREMSVQVLSGGTPQIRLVKYAGAAPTLGQSVEIAAGGGNQRRVTGIARKAGAGLILGVFTATTEVEVLFGV